MSGAVFIVAINLAVAGLIAVGFLFIASHEKGREAGRWLAAAYFMGIAYSLVEFWIRATDGGPPLVALSTGSLLTSMTFIARVKKFPELASKARGYIRVAQRRWNIRLDNGVTVKLPERGEERAMAALVAMDKDNNLLSRDIAAVDMRLDDRVVVQLTEEAAEKREAALKELSKPGRKPAEKRI